MLFDFNGFLYRFTLQIWITSILTHLKVNLVLSYRHRARSILSSGVRRLNIRNGSWVLATIAAILIFLFQFINSLEYLTVILLIILILRCILSICCWSLVLLTGLLWWFLELYLAKWRLLALPWVTQILLTKKTVVISTRWLCSILN